MDISTSNGNDIVQIKNPNMNSTNFSLLSDRWPKLFEFADHAERYVFSDPHTAIIKLRCFAEIIVSELYQHLCIPCNPESSFFERLKDNEIEQAITPEILRKLHAIRILGNKAAHGQQISSDDAKALLLDAYLIGQWFYKSLQCDLLPDYPAYLEPAPSSTEQLTIQHLTEQLSQAKTELEQLEHSEKKALQQLASLNQSLDELKKEAFVTNSIRAASSFDLIPENTSKLISIHDAFSQYSLSDGQTELVNRLDNFLSNKEHSVFLLKGYAGTGKTFITKGLTDYFKDIGRNFVLSAPTGKASKVISKKTGCEAYTIHKTIYSFKDIAEYRDDGLDGSQTYKFYAQLAVNDNSVDTVYIVDESSMIPDVYQENEFFRCGSGHLLCDLLKYVNLDHNDHQKKIIFIGDDAQLPPVGMNFSPALSEQYLQEKFNVSCTTFELTEVVRQKSGSGVMLNATELRAALGNKLFNRLSINTEPDDVEKLEHHTLLSTYLSCCENKVSDKAIIIAYSNAEVTAHNREIRACLFPDQPIITRGDKVMAINNNSAYGFFISNGDFGQVKEVADYPEERTIQIKNKIKETGKVEETHIILTFRKVVIGFRNLDGVPIFFSAQIMEDLLYSEQGGLSSDQNKALYIDFCIRHRNLRPGTEAFKDTLKSDPYFNALRLKFGYAITCHKAQGSEWEHVIVKCKTHQNQLTADYFRWLYTAITRTTGKLYVLDPPDIKPWTKAKNSAGIIYPTSLTGASEVAQATDTQHSPPYIAPIKETTETMEHYYTVQPDTSSLTSIPADKLNIPDGPNFFRSVLEKVQLFIAGYGIEIESISHNQNQEAYCFRQANDFARINIIYKNSGKISNIVPYQQGELCELLVNLLKPMQESIIIIKQPGASQSFVFNEEFMNEFHDFIVSLTSSKNIQVHNVEQQQYCQLYTFIKDSDTAVYKFWYNKKKQISSREPVQSRCSGHLLHELEELLAVGLSA